MSHRAAKPPSLLAFMNESSDKSDVNWNPRYFVSHTILIGSPLLNFRQFSGGDHFFFAEIVYHSCSFTSVQFHSGYRCTVFDSFQKRKYSILDVMEDQLTILISLLSPFVNWNSDFWVIALHEAGWFFFFFFYSKPIKRDFQIPPLMGQLRHWRELHSVTFLGQSDP